MWCVLGYHGILLIRISVHELVTRLILLLLVVQFAHLIYFHMCAVFGIQFHTYVCASYRVPGIFWVERRVVSKINFDFLFVSSELPRATAPFVTTDTIYLRLLGRKSACQSRSISLVQVSVSNISVCSDFFLL